MEEDPDFLALPPRVRARIDRAFDRGLPKLRRSGRKRRKLNRDDDAGPSHASTAAYEGEGGFMEGGDDAGGYAPGGGEDGAGGFMAEDEGSGGGFVADDDEGGFIPDDPEAESTSRPATSSPPTRSAQLEDISASTKRLPLRSGKVPLSSIPQLLALLNIPADEDVLHVFKASAKGWTEAEDEAEAVEGGRRRGRGKGEEGDDKLGVDRNDFRAVCAAIMDGAEEDDGDENAMDIDANVAAGVGDNSDSEDDEDTFEMDEGSELSSLSSDSEYGASRKKTRAAASSSSKAKEAPSASTTPRKTRRKKADLLEQKGPLKLGGRQREIARELWDMMKGPADEASAKKGRKGDASAFVLGREEVKKWVREMGEMWTEDEITDMVSLFSTQHEARGLSFDDFGQVMLRARVI